LLQAVGAGAAVHFLLICGTESVPGGQLLYGVAPRRVLVGVLPGRAGMVHGAPEVFFEVLELQPLAADETARERLFDQRLQLEKTERRDRVLPALPDVAFVLRLETGVARAQKTSGLLA